MSNYSYLVKAISFGGGCLSVAPDKRLAGLQGNKMGQHQKDRQYTDEQNAMPGGDPDAPVFVWFPDSQKGKSGTNDACNEKGQCSCFGHGAIIWRKSPAGSTGRTLKLAILNVLGRVIHLEFNRMWRHFKGVNFFPLKLHIGVNLIIGEDITFFQEFTISIK